MTIYDLEPYATEGLRKGSFNRKLAQTEELPQLLLSEVANKGPWNRDWEEAVEFIKLYSYKHRGNHTVYSLNSVSHRGTHITEFEVYELNYEGYTFPITYNGITYIINALSTGEVHNVWVGYTTFYSSTSHTKLCYIDSLESINAEALAIITKDKRTIMNHYNHKIKVLKQEYRNRLTKTNSLIKQLSANDNKEEK